MFFSSVWLPKKKKCVLNFSHGDPLPYTVSIIPWQNPWSSNRYLSSPFCNYCTAYDSHEILVHLTCEVASSTFCHLLTGSGMISQFCPAFCNNFAKVDFPTAGVQKQKCGKGIVWQRPFELSKIIFCHWKWKCKNIVAAPKLLFHCMVTLLFSPCLFRFPLGKSWYLVLYWYNQRTCRGENYHSVISPWFLKC